MSGACGEHEGMDEGAFAAHIQEIATQIKDKVAELAAFTVMQDAENARTAVQSVVDYENEQRQWDAQYDPDATYTPMQVPGPPDRGYSLLDESWKELIDDYRNNYEVDLLAFDHSDEQAAENALKNEHLTWIPELFERGGGFPKPENADDAISALEAVAGADAIVQFSVNEDGQLDGEAADNLNDSTLTSAVNADVAEIKDTISSWDSATSDVFRTQFLPKIPVAAGNQINVLRVLRNLLGAHFGIMKEARRDIDGIAHDGLEAVESFGGGCSDGGADISVILGVAGGIIAIAGGITTLAAGGAGITLIGAGIGILGGVVNTAKTLEGIERKPYELGADTLDGTVEKIREAVEKTYTDLDEGYTTLASLTTTVTEGMTGNPSLVRAPRPAGADGETAFPDATPEDVRDTVE